MSARFPLGAGGTSPARGLRAEPGEGSPSRRPRAAAAAMAREGPGVKGLSFARSLGASAPHPAVQDRGSSLMDGSFAARRQCTELGDVSPAPLAKCSFNLCRSVRCLAVNILQWVHAAHGALCWVGVGLGFGTVPPWQEAAKAVRKHKCFFPFSPLTTSHDVQRANAWHSRHPQPRGE